MFSNSPSATLADCASILSVRNQDEFRAVIRCFAEKLGFDRFSAIIGYDNPSGKTRFFGVSNAEQAYLDAPHPIEMSLDPVARHCRSSSLPIIWDHKTYLESGQMSQYEFQAAYGYRAGIAVACHLPHGRHFMIGFDRDKGLPEDANEVGQLISSFQLLSVYAQEAAFKILHDPDALAHRRSASELSRREVECLRWTAEGKTSPD